MPITEAVVARSLECARRHRLRGADALQLAGALIAAETDVGIDTVAAFDRRLRAAASAEGFALLPTG